MIKSKFTPQEKARIILESINIRISNAELPQVQRISPDILSREREIYQRWQDTILDNDKKTLQLSCKRRSAVSR